VSGIFICYRREDDGHAAGRLHDSLGQRFPKDQIFLDVDNIEPGQTFVSAIQERVAASDAMIVVIGPRWLDSKDSNGQRRLDNPKDFVRLEIEEALKRNIRVIPVLFDVAVMPQAEAMPPSISALTGRHAIKFHYESFSRDAEYLNNVLAKVVAPAGKVVASAEKVVASAELSDGRWRAKISPNRKRKYVSIEFWLSVRRGEAHCAPKSRILRSKPSRRRPRWWRMRCAPMSRQARCASPLESLTDRFMLQMGQVSRFTRERPTSPKRVFAETMAH
jgi:hypothetical protein